MFKKLEQAVKELTTKTTDASNNSDDALKYTQAVLNLTHAISELSYIKTVENK